MVRKWKSGYLPRHGTPVLAFDGKRVIRAKWVPKYSDDNVSDDGDFYDYRESDDTYWLPEGWYECVSHWGDYSLCHITDGEVTHWMPMPDKPE